MWNVISVLLLAQQLPLLIHILYNVFCGDLNRKLMKSGYQTSFNLLIMDLIKCFVFLLFDIQVLLCTIQVWCHCFVIHCNNTMCMSCFTKPWIMHLRGKHISKKTWLHFVNKYKCLYFSANNCYGWFVTIKRSTPFNSIHSNMYEPNLDIDACSSSRVELKKTWMDFFLQVASVVTDIHCSCFV